MFKRILVPLDGSELAEKALPYAQELAVKLGSEVYILNVRMPSEDPANPEHRAYISKIAAVLEQDIRKNPALKKGGQAKVASVIIGSPGPFIHAGEQIIDYAAKENISLIIIASHGRSGIRRWALGSSANKVAGAAECPVLLVRAGAALRTSRPSQLLVTLDGSKESETVLEYVAWLAPRLVLKVSLLHVVETLYHFYPAVESVGYFGGAGMLKVAYSAGEMKPFIAAGETYIKAVNDKLASSGISTTYDVRMGSPADEIIKAEKDTGADIVVMATYGHSGFGRWDHGSVADKVMHAGALPLLLVRPKKK